MSVRIARIALILLFILGLLVLRLSVVMLFPGTAVLRSLHTGARVQTELEHLHVLRVDDGRGRILFRNGLPWSGTFKSAATAAAAHTQNRLHMSTPHETTPFLIHSEKTASGVQPPLVVGRVGLPDHWPSAARNVAEQGRSGLEYTFDYLLRQGHPGYAGALDKPEHAVSKRLFWLPVQPGIDIRTTIDPAWQNTAETAMTRNRIKRGAVVVLAIKDREVLAMASRNNTSPQVNEAVKAYTPGSIFKIVTGAASLESYRYSPQASFYCDGQLQEPGITLKCWRKHGRENFLQAFAGSCNTVFAELGLHAGEKALTYTAQRFGLMSTGLQRVDGHPVLPEADAGKVFRTDNGHSADRGDLAHTAIGQQDVRVSPLQGANLAATIAAGGVYQEARLVLDAQRERTPQRTFDRVHTHTAVSRSTAGWIGEAMHMTTHWNGGTAFDLAPTWADPAVKTGTAEVEGGKVNAWIVGYAPYRDPKIAFCVFVGPGSSRVSHEQVHAVTKELLESYRQFQGSHVIG